MAPASFATCSVLSLELLLPTYILLTISFGMSAITLAIDFSSSKAGIITNTLGDEFQDLIMDGPTVFTNRNGFIVSSGFISIF